MRNLATVMLRALVACAMCAVLAPQAHAQSALSEELGGLSWGASMDEVLSLKRDEIMEAYRTEIAGLRDPIEIDRLRRVADAEYTTIEDSVRVFDQARTGYEVSVIQDEVSGAAGQSMLSVREEWSTHYYVFQNDGLAKLVVTYDQASLNFLGFEAFVERLEAVFGGPESTDWRVDDIGVRHMTRATWEDGDTRVRIEDKSRMFASYLLVYSDAAHVEPERVDPGTAASGNRPTTSRNIGSLIRRMDEETEGTRDNSAVVDSIIGSSTEVELRLRVDEGEVAEIGTSEGGSALDDDEVLEDAERLERRSRSSDDDDEEEETPTDEGGIIY